MVDDGEAAPACPLPSLCLYLHPHSPQTPHTTHSHARAGCHRAPAFLPGRGHRSNDCGRQSATARRAGSPPAPLEHSSTTTMDDGPPRDLERLFTELGLRKYGLETEGLEKDEDEAVADGTCWSGEGRRVRVCVSLGFWRTPYPSIHARLCPPAIPTCSRACRTYLFVSRAASSHCFSLPPSLPPPTQPVASAPGSVGGPWCSAPSFFFPSSSTALC